jgi:PrtD family type I secretion system ABC transporter
MARHPFEPRLTTRAQEHAMKSLKAELKPLLVHLAAFSFVINLLFLVPAVFTLQVFDRVIPSSSGETLAVLLVGVGIALAILLVLDYARLRLQHVTGNIIDERLSPPVIQTIVKATALAPHSVRADAIRDVGLLRNLFAANGVTALFDAPWVVVYVGVIWLFHPVLGIGAAVCAALMLVLAWLNDRLTRGALDALQIEGQRASRQVEGSLRNAEVLQAMGMTERLLDRWRKQQNEVLDMQTRATRTSVAFIAITKFVRQAIQVAMMSLGAYLVLTQQASAGVMIATTILLGRAVQPVEQLVGSWRTLSDARAAYRRLMEISKYFATEQPRVTLPRPEGRISVDGVTFRPPHSDKMLLAGVSLDLAPGEALAIVGPSAAGKSTLARLLTGIWLPSAGKVRLDGVDVSDWPRAELGPWIGYVPQDVELFDGTVAQNIGRMNELDSEAVIAAAARAIFTCVPTVNKATVATSVGAADAAVAMGQELAALLAGYAAINQTVPQPVRNNTKLILRDAELANDVVEARRALGGGAAGSPDVHVRCNGRRHT